MLATAVGAVLTGSAAFGAITAVGLVPVAISAGAKADDAALNNYSSFDLQVTLDTGDHFAGADIRAQANGSAKWYAADNSGGYYTPTFQTGASPRRFLTFDTAIGTPSAGANPDGTRVSILGSSSRKTPPDLTPTFPSNGSNWGTAQDVDGNWTAWNPANSQQLVDVSWGDVSATTNNNAGVKSIARLTISGTGLNVFTTNPGSGVVATIVGQAKATSDATAIKLYTFFLAPNVPEPTSVALMGLGLGAVALRRRSR